MEIQKESYQHTHHIHSYSNNHLMTRSSTIKLPCLITPNRIEPLKNIECLNEACLDNLRQEGIEILVIGAQKPQDYKNFTFLSTWFNVDYMNVRSAVYAFNILLSEKRKCAAVFYDTLMLKND